MRAHRLAVLAIATALAALAAEQQQNSARPEDRVLAAMGPMNPAVAVAWNQTAYEIVFAEDQFFRFTGHLALAMTHVAIHDALNAFIPLYGQYSFTGHDS